MKKRIVFFHMLNDFSGSPHVLALVIKGLVERGYNADLYTSSQQGGFLAGIEGVKYHHVYYKFTNNKIITFILFVYAQIRYFFIVLKLPKKNTVIYVNTILPFGAVIAAALVNREVIYHVHENPINKNLIQRLALKVFHKFSYKRIFVSKYVNEQYVDKNKIDALVYNSLSKNFNEIAKLHTINLIKPFTILMVCSLKKYKGVDIFREIAFKLSDYNFILVLNANDSEIKSYFENSTIPTNLKIYSQKTNLHPFYSSSHLVMNLSISSLVVETFGLTALEAIAYGIPVIVPTVGGIAEIIDDGIQGYKVDSCDQDLLIKRIKQVFSDEKTYYDMSLNARRRADFFYYSKMIDEIEQVVK